MTIINKGDGVSDSIDFPKIHPVSTPLDAGDKLLLHQNLQLLNNWISDGFYFFSHHRTNCIGLRENGVD